MATEYRLPYNADEINRRLRDVDTKANIMPLSSAEYDALEKVNANTLYMLTDIEDDDAQMVVVIADAETASRSFNEIKAHVEAGGTAVVNDGAEYYPLVLLAEDYAMFAAVEDDAYIYGCKIYSDDTVEYISVGLATLDDIAPAIVVTIDMNNEEASHSFSEIKAYVEAGRTVVARKGSTEDEVCSLYRLSDLDNHMEEAVFTSVINNGYLNTVYVCDDKTCSFSATNLKIGVTDKVTKGSASAVQSGAVYNFVTSTAYNNFKQNLTDPIEQRLDDASIDELITVEDIDTICGATITYVDLDEGAF